MNKIIFQCTVSQIRTLADGGIRLTLDLPEKAIAQSAMLMDCKRQGIPLLAEISADVKDSDTQVIDFYGILEKTEIGSK